MTELAAQMESECGPTGANVSTLPRSFSTNSRSASSDQDLAELVRIASRRGLTKKVEPEYESRVTEDRVSIGGVPHRRSLTLEKIDEDKVYDFDGIEGFAIKYPRSKSHAVSSNRMF
ncbi:hypothetical protein R6Q59_028522 [Mikania micrantha]